MQAFFATQGEALVYFMMVILQCAPLASWRALAVLSFFQMQVSSVCWVGVRIPLPTQ
jgi:NhaP-type Na+/H+ and K+/H+ antiporter